MKKYFLYFILFFSAGITLAHQPKEGTTIHMTADGFTPSEITIPVGDSVIFENTDTNSRWPASNIHPSHAIYPDFDPKEPIKPGEGWEFKFTKAGVWKFHDHIYSQFGGTITVTGDSAEKTSGSFFEKITGLLRTVASKILALLKDTEDLAPLDNQNMKTLTADQNLLKSYLKKYGVARIMEQLISESGGGSTFDCHQEAHTIGRTGYDLYGEESFQQCDASCHSGCYHGAMESFLNKSGTTDLGRNIERICNKFETSFGNFECLHGVGHGVLAYLDYDLPESIKECRNLNSSFGQSSCFGGLFMENILTGQGLGADTQEHTTSWVNRADPHFPCNKIDSSYDLQYQCWQMQTSWMLTIAGYNFDLVAQQCLQAPKNMVSVCFKSLGRDIGGYTLRDSQRILDLCQKTPDKYRTECLVGALNVIIDFWGPGLKDQAAQLCALTQEPHKNICYSELIGRIGGIFKTKEEKHTMCNMLESVYKERCLNIY